MELVDEQRLCSKVTGVEGKTVALVLFCTLNDNGCWVDCQVFSSFFFSSGRWLWWLWIGLGSMDFIDWPACQTRNRISLFVDMGQLELRAPDWSASLLPPSVAGCFNYFSGKLHLIQLPASNCLLSTVQVAKSSRFQSSDSRTGFECAPALIGLPNSLVQWPWRFSLSPAAPLFSPPCRRALRPHLANRIGLYKCSAAALNWLQPACSIVCDGI